MYHVAALGIVYKKDTHKQKYYSSHDDDILCLALHPTSDYVATGQIGRDPSIHVWDSDSMECLSVLQGEHYRGVCAVDFSGKIYTQCTAVWYRVVILEGKSFANLTF